MVSSPSPRSLCRMVFPTPRSSNSPRSSRRGSIDAFDVAGSVESFNGDPGTVTQGVVDATPCRAAHSWMKESATAPGPT